MSYEELIKDAGTFVANSTNPKAKRIVERLLREIKETRESHAATIGQRDRLLAKVRANDVDRQEAAG